MNQVDPELHYRHVRRHSDSLFWGTLIILIGVAWLGINLGYFDSGIWYQLFRLWPILLIIWGLNILVRRTPLQLLVYVTPLILVAAFIWVVAGKPMWLGPMAPRGSRLSTALPSRTYAELKEYHYVLPREKGVSELTAEVDAGAAEVLIDTLPADSDCVAEIDCQTSRGEPGVSMKVRDGVAHLEIPKRQDFQVSLAHPLPGKERTEIHLSCDLPLDLELNVGASTVNAELSQALLRSLRLNGGAASVDASLPEAGDAGYQVVIKAGAASLQLRLPQDTPVYLESTSALSAANFREAGLIRRQRHWESPNYDPQEPHARIELEGALSSIAISFEP